MQSVPSSFDEVPIAYARSGAGRPAIVFVHGLVGDHHDFDAQISHFSQSYQTVAVDLPGVGASGHDRATWTMESLGGDIATVVDHLNLDDVLLVGHSLGGNAITEAALLLMSRVVGVVWVSSFRSLDSTMTASEMETWFAPFHVDFAAAMDDLNRRNFGPGADPALVEAVTTRARGADRDRTLGLLRSKFGHAGGVVAALPEIDAPVVAINGDSKPNDAVSFGKHGVELRIVPGVGHFVMREDPAAFNGELEKIIHSLP